MATMNRLSLRAAVYMTAATLLLTSGITFSQDIVSYMTRYFDNVVAPVTRPYCSADELRRARPLFQKTGEAILRSDMNAILALAGENQRVNATLTPKCQNAFIALGRGGGGSPGGGHVPQVGETICVGGVCCGPRGCTR